MFERSALLILSRQLHVLKEEIDDLHTRVVSWDEWKEITSEWCNSLMVMLFGDTVMDEAPQISALQDWMEQSPL